MTAICLIPAVVLITLYLSSYWMFLAVALVTLLALAEYNKLTSTGAADGTLDWLTLALGALVPFTVYFSSLSAAAAVVAAAAFVFLLYGVLNGADPAEYLRRASLRSLGVAYIALPFSYMILLRELPSGGWWVLFLLSIIWSNDTLAFAGGKTFGRHRMTPVISPKKTYEGLACGIIGGVIGAALFNMVFGMGLGMTPVIITSVCVGFIGVAGDLIESLFKRAAGVKDSGSIVPGHGGVLDRIDSLIFAAPALYYLLRLFGAAGSS